MRISLESPIRFAVSHLTSEYAQLKATSRVTTLQQPPYDFLEQIDLVTNKSGVLSDREIEINKFVVDSSAPTLIHNRYSHGGLGDKVIALRQAAAIARHFPQRKFYIDTETAIPVAPLALPGNVNLTESLHSQMLPLPGTILNLGFFTRFDIPPEAENSSQFDFEAMHLLRLAGVSVDYDAYYQSIFSFTPEDLRNSPVTSDLLVIPDALETRSTVDKAFHRSRKSLPVKKWGEIFEQLDPSMQIALVMGTAHMEYCEAVINAARKVGLRNIQVVEGSLNDVVHAILTTKKFVGMDSGTTHIAAEVVKAAQVKGRIIEFREIFHEGVYSYERYGIVGKQFQTLVCSDDLNDLAGVATKTVINFIKS